MAWSICKPPLSQAHKLLPAPSMLSEMRRSWLELQDGRYSSRLATRQSGSDLIRKVGDKRASALASAPIRPTEELPLLPCRLLL